MEVVIENSQNRVKVTEEMLDLIRKAAALCLEEENFKFESEIGVTLVDDEKIREINREYRKKDSPTDVLSFPMLDMQEGELLEEMREYDMDEGKILLGDIVISLETAERQARDFGHSFERELGFLVTHAMYHLLGYDHLEADSEALMIEKQEAVLQKMGLGREPVG